jgi:DNA topoisomerase IB
VTRLRTVSVQATGITRRRRGSGFSYLDASGHPVSAQERRRIEDLVIPPAWADVWICPWANGHIQAVGTDVAGRRQYLYHPAWRERRDQEKFDHAVLVGQRLPRARATVTRHLGRTGMPRERSLATAFRLLDLGFFRIGGETYAQSNHSYGLATLLRRHAQVRGSAVSFRYDAKSGQRRLLTLDDPQVVSSLRALLSRRGGGSELLAFKDGRRWHDVTSADINDYVKERLGDDVSAKDFRTWHATVLAAAELSANAGDAASKSGRERVIRAAVAEVADQLGNTPTIARNSYIDPQVIELFRRGTTVDLRARGTDIIGSPRARAAAEKALLGLLAT